MSVSEITKHIIWAEIETLEIVMAMARQNGIEESHQFMRALSDYKKRIERDLIVASES